ncbi:MULTISPECIES: hypothetical protein [unclassified Streptosporangium]|uniref:hypothetical protein n=1 Tax=unclassified Streptosporangium TaxID=2632669 RepID=UPI002E294706|nr:MULTISPECIES: hypothetical protein [unclassified Streptosporangium]
MLRVYAPPCIRTPHTGNFPVWRLVFIVVLLIFVIAAHLLGMAIEVTLLVITTMTGVVLQLTKPAADPLKAL